ncbi:nucleotidyltransferase [Oceanobacillus saliphilus]|uniref:nucleotidyltransferase n=1 Tax=Oceanobacillus saliphilus TaxID=2925834 RepID=UPI00201DFAA9|nr:nucleotidyltransferase [Oceanobacillus saliphilus]
MNACGLIVEYNPFHNGHVYHIEEARKASGADCMIAVMSGNFLQRGEPAVIDKFHRAQAALRTGIDIVLELPYLYAVQNSDLFADGAVKTLNEIGVTSICFGSESGSISNFITSYHNVKENQATFKTTLKQFLNKGFSFPEASKHAYKSIGLTGERMDLSKPNNILGYSYVKTILENNLPITPLTIQRTNNDFHDKIISSTIASATSIRGELLKHDSLTSNIVPTIPEETANQLKIYREKSSVWHEWEKYFPLLSYRVLTMTASEIAAIHDVEEGLENRILKTAQKATSFHDWMEAIKTKRYTWTRIQRIFVHILTNTKKADMESVYHPSIPYVRLLGMTETGREYLNKQKKLMNVPLISKLTRNQSDALSMEEKAANAYYSILPTQKRNLLFKQELQAPIISTKI